MYIGNYTHRIKMKSTHSTYKKHKKTRHHRRTKTSPGQRSNCEPAKRVLSAKHPLKLVIEGYAAQKPSDKKGGDLLQPNVPVNKRQFLFQKQLRQKNLRLQKQPPVMQPQIPPPPPPKPDCGTDECTN